MIVKSYTFVNMCKVFDRSFLQTLSAISPENRPQTQSLSKFNRAAAHGSARLPDDEFGSILAANAAKMLVLPTHKYCPVNNLAFDRPIS
jgi:hypothetical protein